MTEYRENHKSYTNKMIIQRLICLVQLLQHCGWNTRGTVSRPAKFYDQIR